MDASQRHPATANKEPVTPVARTRAASAPTRSAEVPPQRPPAPAPAVAPSTSEEDLLREMEKEFEDSARAAAKKVDASGGGEQTGRSRGTSTTRTSADAPSRNATRTNAETKKSSTDLEIDSLLADIEGTLSTTSPPPAKTPVKLPPKASIDPILTEHLKWLKTFNTTFLNAYESRNASLSAGTRKRA